MLRRTVLQRVLDPLELSQSLLLLFTTGVNKVFCLDEGETLKTVFIVPQSKLPHRVCLVVFIIRSTILTF